MKHLVMLAAFSLGINTMSAAEPAVSLKIISKKAAYAWPVADKPELFAKKIKEIQQGIKAGKNVDAPDSIEVDFVLQFTNTGKETVDIFVQGDSNLMTLEVTGPGVIAISPPRPMTLEFRLPKQVTIEAGKTFEIPVKQLSDGMRGISRSIYFTTPGDFEIKASYQLCDADGQKSGLLKSAAVKFSIDAPK